jgi:hypothetical protein
MLGVVVAGEAQSGVVDGVGDLVLDPECLRQSQRIADCPGEAGAGSVEGQAGRCAVGQRDVVAALAAEAGVVQRVAGDRREPAAHLQPHRATGNGSAAADRQGRGVRGVELPDRIGAGRVHPDAGIRRVGDRHVVQRGRRVVACRVEIVVVRVPDAIGVVVQRTALEGDGIGRIIASELDAVEEAGDVIPLNGLLDGTRDRLDEEADVVG